MTKKEETVFIKAKVTEEKTDYGTFIKVTLTSTEGDAEFELGTGLGRSNKNAMRFAMMDAIKNMDRPSND